MRYRVGEAAVTLLAMMLSFILRRLPQPLSPFIRQMLIRRDIFADSIYIDAILSDGYIKRGFSSRWRLIIVDEGAAYYFQSTLYIYAHLRSDSFHTCATIGKMPVESICRIV